MNRFDLEDKSDEYGKELADSGNFTAIFDYGFRMYNQEKYEESFKYFYQLKDSSNFIVWEKIITLATEYLPGIISDKEIFEFLLKRHARGSSIYTYKLAYFYRDGRGTRRSLKKYIECLKACSNDRSKYATIELAECYEKGFGVRQSYRKAYQLYYYYVDDHDKMDYTCAYRAALYMLEEKGGAKKEMWLIKYHLRYAARIIDEAKELYIKLFNEEPTW